MTLHTDPKKHPLLDHPLAAAALMILFWFGFQILSLLLLKLVFQTMGCNLQDPLAAAFLSFLNAVLGSAIQALWVKKILNHGYVLGMTFHGFGKCLMFGSIFVVLIWMNAFVNPAWISEISLSGILIAVLTGSAPGFGEEFLFRGTIANNMMRVWGMEKNGIRSAVLWSGILFGVIHSLNGFLTGLSLEVLLQIMYASAIGLLLGAAYIRTRCLWGCIVLHSAIDISAYLPFAVHPQTNVALQSASQTASLKDVAVLILFSIVCTLLAFFLIRKSKQKEIQSLWNLS